MVQLLHKLSIRAAAGAEKLLKVVKNPVTQYFPAGCAKIGTSVTGELVEMKQFIATLPADQPVVYCFGSHAHGPADVDWTEKSIAVSAYPLSAATALSRLTHAYEDAWGIL